MEPVLVLRAQRPAVRSLMATWLTERPWEPAVAVLLGLAAERQPSVQQEVASVQPLVAPAEAQHEAVRAEPAVRLSAQRAEVEQRGEPAVRVVPSEQRLEARHEVAEPLSVVQVERPLAALSVQPSDLQELARRLAQQ
jgi:hypothetical protein